MFGPQSGQTVARRDGLQCETTVIKGGYSFAVEVSPLGACIALRGDTDYSTASSAFRRNLVTHDSQRPMYVLTN
jgi:hypothetical protein